MLSYLNAEANFIRAFGNRCLLLIFLCALTRTTASEKISAFGVSLDISPGVIVVLGPPLALLFLVALKLEADVLLLARESVLEESTKLNWKAEKVSSWVYPLFCVPTVAAAFLTLQFILKLFPTRCSDWNWIKQFTDFSFWTGNSSVYCIRDQEGPWIYPPIQTYLYFVCLVACAYLTWQIARDWPRLRGTPR
jgi:hypothetical protein